MRRRFATRRGGTPGLRPAGESVARADGRLRGYSGRMSRSDSRQSDLFSPRQPDPFAAPPAEPAPPGPDPLDELTALLDTLRAADRLPWPHLTAVMEAEYRELFLARQAGAEGARLASAIMEQTERLFSAAERAGRAM